MIHDAKVEVTCDHPGCTESIEVDLPFSYDLPFNYPDLSGKGGRYDHRLSAIRKRIEREAWSVVGEEGDEKTFCTEHSEAEAR